MSSNSIKAAKDMFNVKRPTKFQRFAVDLLSDVADGYKKTMAINFLKRQETGGGWKAPTRAFVSAFLAIDLACGGHVDSTILSGFFLPTNREKKYIKDTEVDTVDEWKRVVESTNILKKLRFGIKVVDTNTFILFDKLAFFVNEKNECIPQRCTAPRAEYMIDARTCKFVFFTLS